MKVSSKCALYNDMGHFLWDTCIAAPRFCLNLQHLCTQQSKKGLEQSNVVQSNFLSEHVES